MDEAVNIATVCARQLSPEEELKLQNDTKLVTEFKQTKLETEAMKNWDLFYKRNSTKFFKDRHWTKREFDELLCLNNSSRKVVLEVGCGVGNFIFPLLEESSDLFFYATDFSKRAVQFVKENPLYSPERCHAFVSDITSDDLLENVPLGGVDVATMIFVLSAIHPTKMAKALMNIFKALRTGGHLLLRDYGQYDHAMLRFGPGHKLADNFYVRQDGTRAYYFSIERLSDLAREAGFKIVTIEYIHRETINKKEGLCVPRVFVQAKLQKHDSQVLFSSGQDVTVTTGVKQIDLSDTKDGRNISDHSNELGCGERTHANTQSGLSNRDVDRPVSACMAQSVTFNNNTVIPSGFSNIDIDRPVSPAVIQNDCSHINRPACSVLIQSNMSCNTEERTSSTDVIRPDSSHCTDTEQYVS